jgi:antitoxin ParD1/3/4
MKDVRLIQEDQTRLASLEAAIARGITDAEVGRVKPLKEVFNRLHAKYVALEKEKRR